MKLVKNLQKSLSEIQELSETPFQIRDIALIHVTRIKENKNLPPAFQNKLQNTIDALENIHHGSIERKFKIIYNQMCVLGVSALSAHLSDFFEYKIDNASTQLNQEYLEKEAIRVPLLSIYDFSEQKYRPIAKVISESRQDINFQDLQSTVRTFHNYFKKHILIEDDLKQRILFYQHSRHVISHNGSKADKKFIDGLAKLDANIKDIKESEEICLSKEDWEDMQDAFISLANIVELAFLNIPENEIPF